MAVHFKSHTSLLGFDLLQERALKHRKSVVSTRKCESLLDEVEDGIDLKKCPVRTEFIRRSKQGADHEFRRTRGNRFGHVVLRGGSAPNYDAAHIALTEQAVAKARLPANIVVDCSHANSFKKPELQPDVFRDCVNQIRGGNTSIVGMMVETNLVAGNQPIPAAPSELIYGCSVTDACIDCETTAALLRESAGQVRSTLASRLGGAQRNPRQATASAD
jgi:phospho-2-dehydro-3-deoxyheptonate aldolase